MMKSIALYGGSFDPIHIGHLITASRVVSELQLEKLIFIPTNKTPLKRNYQMAPAPARLEMIKLSIEDVDYFSVSDFEIKKDGVSYTYDTVKHFKKIYSDYKIYFIIGTDRVKDLKNWYNIEKLKELVTFIFVSRNKENLERLTREDNFYQNIDYKIVKNNILEISSTLIRENVQENKKIDYMVVEKCKKYIKESRLYADKRNN